MKVKLTLLWLTFCVRVSAQYSFNYLEELNPALFQTDFSAYSQSTAIYTALLSDIAYWPQADYQNLITDLQKKYPDEKIVGRFLQDKKTSTEAILFGTKKFTIISFRGTQETRDLVTDSKILFSKNHAKDSATVYRSLARGPRGFRAAMKSFVLNTDFFDTLQDFNTLNYTAATKKPVYVTGHSLGAALAKMVVPLLADNGFNFAGSYAFAQPLCTDFRAADSLEHQFGSKCYNIVFYKDYIARALAHWRKSLKHYGYFLRINTDYVLYKEDECYVAFDKGEQSNWLDYHSLNNYLAGLRDIRNTTEALNIRWANGDASICLSGKQLENCRRTKMWQTKRKK